MLKKLFGIILVFIAGVTIIAAIAILKSGEPISSLTPSSLTQGLVGNSAVPAAAEQNIKEEPVILAEKVVSDLKTDISNLYQAWKGSDINEFRQIAALGYYGTLLETKIKEAEPFILEGEGAEINNLNFLELRVLELQSTRAIVDCTYNYAGFAYNSATQARGQMMSAPKSVKKQYTLELKDNHWYITAEQ